MPARRSPLLRHVAVFVWCCAGSSAALIATEPRVLDDFAAGGANWQPWADAQSTRPQIKPLANAVEGKPGAEFVFPYTTHTALVALQTHLPPEMQSLSFWIRQGPGGGGVNLVLGESAAACPEGADFFSAPVPLTPEWKKISLPLSAFTYAYSQHGAGNRRLELDKIEKLMFVSQQNATLFAFSLAEVTADSGAKPSPAAGPAAFSANLVRGDTSFETGPGQWNFYSGQDESPRRDPTTAALGQASLLIPPSASGVTTPWLLEYTLEAGQAYTLSFFAKAERAPTNFTARLISTQWQHLGGKTFALTTEWQRYEVPVPAPKARQRFFISLGGQAEATTWVDGIQLQTGPKTDYAPSEPLSLWAGVETPGELLSENPNEPARLNLRIANAARPETAGPLNLTLTVRDQAGIQQSEFTRPLTLKPGELFAEQFSALPQTRPGYYVAGVVLRDAQNQTVATEEFPFGVVPPRPAAGAQAFPYFGTHAYKVPPQALAAIGVGVIRSLAQPWWDAQPKADAPVQVQGFAKTLDKYAAAGLQVYPFIEAQRNRVPRWAQNEVGTPRDENAFANYVRTLAETYRDRLDTWEIQNEPDLSWVSHINLSSAEGADRYVKLLRPTVAALHTVNPKMKVAFNISGGDVGGFAFSARVFDQAADLIDIFALHPYASPRFFGANATYSVSPEQNRMRQKLLAAVDFIKHYGGKQELWIGELGWALDREAPFSDALARNLAEYLVRAHLIGLSVPEVKRQIWFLAEGCQEGERYEYGMWRSNARGLYPLPGAVAYANLSALFHQAQFIRPLIESDIRAYLFQTPAGLLAALWQWQGDPAAFRPEASTARVLNIYGQELTTTDATGLKLSGSPLYVLAGPVSPEQFASELLRGISLESPLSVELRASTRSTLALELRNRAPTEAAGTFSVRTPGLAVREAGGGEFRLPPGQTAGFTLPLAGGARLLPAGGAAQITITQDGKTTMHNRELPRFREIPGDAGQAGIDFTLDRREQVLPADPTVGWEGPEDLSAHARLSWNEAGLRLRIEVRDDRQVQTHADAQIWRGDSLQVALDPLNNAAGDEMEYAADDREYGFALAANGPVAWRYHGGPSGPLTGATVKIERREADKLTVYDLLLPWNELGLDPQTDPIFGFSFIVNDDDGSGRNYWLGLTPGIGEMKKPSWFEKFSLAQKR